MPKVDREMLVGFHTEGVNGPKLAVGIPACGDLAKGDAVELPSDTPPESVWLSKDEELDWLSRNAFLVRKESTKGNSIVANLSHSCNPNHHNFNSPRVSIGTKSKAHVIGLPRTQRTSFVDPKRKTYRAVHTSLFPKESKSQGMSVAIVTEPTSPKVSCVGKVRSKRCSRQSNSKSENSAETNSATVRSANQKTSFCSMLLSVFQSREGKKKQARSRSRRVAEEPAAVEEPARKSRCEKSREIPERTEPPGLGGLKRLSSGRRSESWTSDEFNQLVAGGVDRSGGRSRR